MPEPYSEIYVICGYQNGNPRCAFAKNSTVVVLSRIYDQSDKRKRVTMNLSLEPSLQGRTITSRRLVHLRVKLWRIRAALSQRIKRLTEDASEDTPGYSIHMADAGTDSFDRDLTLGLASFEQEALYEVDEALQRIDDGTYGVCELTGRPIPWKRLEAIPWTRFSIEAEVKLETLGTHPHIGLLGTVQPEGGESFEAPFDLPGESFSGEPTEHRASGLVSEESVS